MSQRIFVLISAFCFLLNIDIVAAERAPRQHAKATFAGGCFWCMEQSFEALPGVIDAISGYTGGKTKNPNYKDVSRGFSGHVEAIQIDYDPQKISYSDLIEAFWHNIDPTNGNGQFCDTGSQYRSVIFYHDAEQKRIAEQSKMRLQKNKPFKGSIQTEIAPASEFYPAETYHQDYYRKNPLSYKFYRFTCGRDGRLKELWGDD